MGKNMLIAVGLEKQDNHYHPIICILGSSRPHIVLRCEGAREHSALCLSVTHRLTALGDTIRYAGDASL